MNKIKEQLKILKIDNLDIKEVTLDVLRKQYWKQAKKHHPDTGGDEKTFKSVNEAYLNLKNYISNNPSYKKSVTSKVTEYDEDMYIVDISLDDFIKKKTIKVKDFYVNLPNYYTPFLTMRKEDRLITININLTDRYFYVNNYKFRYTVIEGIAVTILEDDDAFDKAVNKMIAITPRGPIGLNNKVKKTSDHIIIRDRGLPVETPLGKVVNSILIISKTKQ